MSPSPPAAAPPFLAAPLRCALCVICFLHAVYDNKLESNTPYDLCGPCTCSDKCVYDYTVVTYFDRSPFRTSSTSQTCFIPMTCCGPPVIYSAEKKCCGGALSSEGFAGVPVYAAPCNMLNLKKSESCPPPAPLGAVSFWFHDSPC